jgi:Na+/H+ antiporter NhaC
MPDKNQLIAKISKGNRINLGIAFLFIVLGVVFAGDIPEQDNHFGWWSVMPPLVAIGLAFWTREVISSLFVGIVLGGVISGNLNVVQEFLIPSIGTESFALILLVYLWSLGDLLAYGHGQGAQSVLLSGPVIK